MLCIKVENFSCIKRAGLNFGQLTVLIGPQASGKSVLSKLAHFFIDILVDQYEHVLENKSFEAFAEAAKTRFSEWFPIAAWGSEKFKIEFEMGEYKLRVTRTSYEDSVLDNLRFWASPLAKTHYKEASELIKSLRQKAHKRTQAPLAELELGWQFRETATRILSEQVGRDFVHYQTYIPAGRSFFTNLGRAFLAFDQARTMDPITIEFGRFYASFQDQFRLFKRQEARHLGGEFAAMLGGTILWEGDRPVLKSPDGRVVPFSALSSGQQELLPLVVALSFFRGTNARKSAGAHLLYIEEPEAHLFPSAQSQLIRALSALVSDPTAQRRLLLTTHSPYVLATINNLIKAGALGTSLAGNKRAKLNDIIAPPCQLPPGTVTAYAIVDGQLEDLIDVDGLIAADYLDSISSEIGKEFSTLLELEISD